MRKGHIYRSSSFIQINGHFTQLVFDHVAIITHKGNINKLQWERNMSLPKILKILQSLPYIICYAALSGKSYICLKWREYDDHPLKLVRNRKSCKSLQDQSWWMPPLCHREVTFIQTDCCAWGTGLPCKLGKLESCGKEGGGNRMNDQIKVMFMLEPLTCRSLWQFTNSRDTVAHHTVCPGLKTCCTQHWIDASQVGHGLLNVHLE